MPDPIEIQKFKDLLLETREQLLSTRKTRDDSAAVVTLDQTTVGRLSRMDAMQQQAMAQSARHRADVSLRRIAAALARCEEGSYGYCLECDEPIDIRRLEFDPTVTMCIQCARGREV